MTTEIIPPRVSLVDARTGMIAREWYLFLLALRQTTDAGTAGISQLALDVATINAALTQTETLLATARSPASIDKLAKDVEALNAAVASLRRPNDLAADVAALKTLMTGQRRVNDSDYAQLVNGSLGVGTRLPLAGSMGNLAAVAGGVFRTFSGTVTAPNTTATTIAVANQNLTNATYIVSCGLVSGTPNLYSAVSLVSNDSNTLRTTALQTATSMTITVSGTNVQATQSSGVSQTLYFTLTRVS